MFNILAILITLAALFAYINDRFIRLPATIGVMAISLVVSLGIASLGAWGLWLGKRCDANDQQH